MAVSKRSQTVSKGLKVPRNPRRRAHPRVSHGLKVPRNPRRRAQSRVSQGLAVTRNPRRRAHPHVPHGLKVPRNPRCRAHPRVSRGPGVPRNPRRPAHPRVSVIVAVAVADDHARHGTAHFTHSENEARQSTARHACCKVLALCPKTHVLNAMDTLTAVAVSRETRKHATAQARNKQPIMQQLGRRRHTVPLTL